MSDTTYDIMNEIADERSKQDEKWGQQNHASAKGGSSVRQFAKAAAYWKAVNDARAEAGEISWDGVLLEEVYEALEEVDPLLRRIELIQVAAVAAAEVACIDRQLASDESPYAELALFEDEPELDE